MERPSPQESEDVTAVERKRQQSAKGKHARTQANKQTNERRSGTNQPQSQQHKQASKQTGKQAARREGTVKRGEARKRASPGGSPQPLRLPLGTLTLLTALADLSNTDT
jgi:hypothetical protein